MKITIDTKEDSVEEIKKVVQLLSTMIKSEITNSSEVLAIEKKPENQAFAEMFGEDKPPITEGSPVDFSGLMGLVNQAKKEEKKTMVEEFPKIIPY